MAVHGRGASDTQKDVSEPRDAFMTKTHQNMKCEGCKVVSYRVQAPIIPTLTGTLSQLTHQRCFSTSLVFSDFLLCAHVAMLQQPVCSLGSRRSMAWHVQVVQIL